LLLAVFIAGDNSSLLLKFFMSVSLSSVPPAVFFRAIQSSSRSAMRSTDSLEGLNS